DNLLESADQKEIKKVEGEMQEKLDTKQETMRGDLQNRMNIKLWSLPSSWSQVSLIIRTKPGVDTLSFDDLYNNYRVFESNVKGSIASFSSRQNVVFVSFDSTNSTNETSHTEDDTENYALMSFNSSNSGSNIEVTSCSIVCEESYANLKKLLVEDEKEKEALKTKFENFQSSSKSLNKLLNSQMSDKDKSGLGSLPMTRIYMPPKSDFGINESKFTYGLKQSKTSESDVKTNNLDSYESNSSVETLESVPKQVKSKPKAVSEPNIWSDAPIIEEYESDSDDKYVYKDPVEQEKSSCAFINTVKHPVTTENKANKTVSPKETNNSVGTQEHIDAGNSEIEAEHVQEYYVLPLWSSYTLTVKSSEVKHGDEKLNGDTSSKITKEPIDQEDRAFLEELESFKRQEKEADDATKTL
nr:hypothetical protein [Tanacetum cinerariifolium]